MYSEDHYNVISFISKKNKKVDTPDVQVKIKIAKRSIINYV